MNFDRINNLLRMSLFLASILSILAHIQERELQETRNKYTYEVEELRDRDDTNDLLPTECPACRYWFFVDPKQFHGKIFIKCPDCRAIFEVN